MPESLANIALFLAKWPVLDAILGILWFRSVLAAWSGYTPPGEKDNEDERNLGATVILAQLNGALTTASIIVAGVGAFVALTPEKLEMFTVAHLRTAAVFAVIALCSTAYTMAILPSRTPNTNFVRSKEVALLSTIPLIGVTFAGVRFACAIWAYLS
ncbi:MULTISPECIES: hypothetical protein [unclassified Rhizobium]|uniref:hypothetical protein n=1 Tax=unclassified Rhizobium TaxID=2613769 RepID=UPI000EA8F0BC|nr:MULTISPECIES: hypothetical protein [unclassified Rhizobium]AYG66893.1 hypothetical protein CCGE531_13465 [Rhizobium sp. CCGE531]AYG73273.1 hypothetical protein CCGE532_12885 [Rhizobium sp. CCGE532]